MCSLIEPIKNGRYSQSHIVMTIDFIPVKARLIPDSAFMKLLARLLIIHPLATKKILP